MIEAIREIGEYSLNQSGKRLDDPVDIIIEDPASTPDYKHVLAIILNEIDQGFVFEGIKQEEYSKEKIRKYIYKSASGNEPDRSPTSRITEIDRTFNKKILKWFKNVLNDKTLQLNEEDKKFLKGLDNCLNQNREAILTELKNKIEHFGKKEKGIITFIIKNPNEKYIGEISVFEKILVEYSTKSYYDKYDTISKAEQKICSVCRKNSDEVYGFVSTYKFYTVDKPGFVSGGFDQRFAWKNYPCCNACALILDEGKKYLKNFQYRVNNFNYYVIPKLLNPQKNQEIYEILKNFKIQTEEGNIKLKKEYGRLLSSDEDDIFELLSQQKNYLNNNLLFYQENPTTKEFKILLYIEDIVPSRLRKLFEAKKEVDNKPIFKKFTEDEKSLSFTFGNIWHFFPRNKEQDMSKYFLEITNNIFVNKKIDNAFLMWGIANKIQKEFAKNNSTKLSTLLGFQLLNYLSYLNLIENSDRGSDMDEKDIDKLLGTSALSVEEKANKLFREFEHFFTNPAKKAVFLEGVLTQLLLNIQHTERHATPFRTKLRGLKLDENLVKRLLPEIQSKLEDYNKNYYRDLEALISKFMIQAGDGWKLSKDEISFYFVLGMNLHYLFKSNTGGKNDE